MGMGFPRGDTGHAGLTRRTITDGPGRPISAPDAIRHTEEAITMPLSHAEARRIADACHTPASSGRGAAW